MENPAVPKLHGSTYAYAFFACQARRRMSNPIYAFFAALAAPTDHFKILELQNPSFDVF